MTNLETARNLFQAYDTAIIENLFRNGPAVNDADFNYRHGWVIVNGQSFDREMVTGVPYDMNLGVGLIPKPNGVPTMTIPAYINVADIKAEYAPYDTMPEFQQGYDYYMDGKQLAHLPKDLSEVGGQAFDRGAEAAMRFLQGSQWIDHNVGGN